MHWLINTIEESACSAKTSGWNGNHTCQVSLKYSWKKRYHYLFGALCIHGKKTIWIPLDLTLWLSGWISSIFFSFSLSLHPLYTIANDGEEYLLTSRYSFLPYSCIISNNIIFQSSLMVVNGRNALAVTYKDTDKLLLSYCAE